MISQRESATDALAYPMAALGGGEPVVSVVVNNYNYAEYLYACIASALGQTYERTEVIVVDDGSTDSSIEVIRGFGTRVSVIAKANGGQASAFNAGFEAASGAIVLFLDADDILLPTAVQRVVDHWRDGVAKVQFRLRSMDRYGDLGPHCFPAERTLPSGDLRAVVRQWATYPAPPTSGNAFGRAVLRQILPMAEDKWKIAADSYLLLSAPFYGDVVSIDEVLGGYRLHGQNAWYAPVGGIERLLQYLQIDESKRDLVRSIAGPSSPAENPGTIRNELRLCAFGAAAQLRPHRGRRLVLSVLGLRAALCYPYWSLAIKVRMFVWYLLAGLLPSKVARRLLR